MPTGSDLSQFVEPPCWRVSRPYDFPEFLRRLPRLVPSNSVLCLQSGDRPDIEAYFLERPAIYENVTDQSFFKFRPKIFYMPITDANLQGLADLSEKHAEAEVGNDLSVYSNGRIILSWHDLPLDPFYVSYNREDSPGRFSQGSSMRAACRGRTRQPGLLNTIPIAID